MDSSKAGGVALVVGVIAIIMGSSTHPRTPEGVLGSGSTSVESNLIINNLSIWYPSHLLLTISIPILLFGYVTIYRTLREKDNRTFSMVALLSILGWAILSFIAVSIDGFLTPILAQKYLDASFLTQPLAAAVFDYNFLLSLTLLAPAFLGLSIGILFFGTSLYNTKTRNQWFALAGIGVGLVGALGYAAGVFGRYWVDSLAFTPYITLLSLWVLVLGILQLRGTSK